MITHRYGASTLGVQNCLFQSCGILESVPALRARVQGIFDSCLFVDNPAGVGVSIATATRVAPYGLKIKNSILWRNGPAPISGTGVVELSDCLVENLAQVLAPNRLVADNFEADPLFVDSLGPDGGPGTLDEDFHLAAGSPCIDRGSPFGRTTDLSGPVSDAHCRGDLGVFESSFFVDCDANGVSDACELNADATLDQNRDRKLDRCEPGADDGGDPNDPGEDRDGFPPPTGCAPLSFPLLALIAGGLALFRRAATSESDGRCA
jgi:hypothetical protein